MAKNSINEDLAQLTLEELRARKNKLKGALIGLGIVMVAALASVLYVVINRKMVGLLATVPAMFLSLIPSAITLSKISGEIKSRQPVQ